MVILGLENRLLIIIFLDLQLIIGIDDVKLSKLPYSTKPV